MPRKKIVYVGIYSSACDTTARAEDVEGKILGVASWSEPININISIKHAWETIKNVVSLSLHESGISINNPDIEINVGLGIKNTELVETCVELKKQNSLFNSFVLAADGYVLLRGSHANDGMIIILDDGIVANAITGNKLAKIGGWGFPHADKGSIPWIGLEAIKLTIQWLDGFIDGSPLLKAIYRHFHCDISKLVKWAMYSRTDPNEYNSICDIVLNFLDKQDKYALLLIQQTAAEANMLYQKLLEKAGISSTPCSLHGRLVPYAEKFFTGVLLENIVKPLGDGTNGAIALIKNAIDKNESGNYTAYLDDNTQHIYSFTG